MIKIRVTVGELSLSIYRKCQYKNMMTKQKEVMRAVNVFVFHSIEKRDYGQF